MSSLLKGFFFNNEMLPFTLTLLSKAITNNEKVQGSCKRKRPYVGSFYIMLPKGLRLDLVISFHD